MRQSSASGKARLHRLESLVKAGRMLNSSLELDVVLSNILALASSLLRSERSTLFLIDEARRELWSRTIEAAAEIRIPLNSGIAGMTATTGRPVIANDVHRFPAFRPEVDKTTGFTTRSILCVPVRGRQGSILGVLQTLNKTGGAFKKSDCRFLEDLAAQAAVAIENALLHERQMKSQALEEDLLVAADIQRKLLPPARFNAPALALAASNSAARNVGGDFYDYRLLAGGGLLAAVGDVSGKGVPAALMMSNLLACLRVLADSCASPAGLMERLNRFMGDFPTEFFCTAFLVDLHPESRTIRYCNAGHPPALLVHGDGSIERLETGGLPLGISSDNPFETGSVALAPDDLILIHTDGVTDARDKAGRRFGWDRLLAALKPLRRLPPEMILAGLDRELAGFTAGAPQADDATLVALRWGPNGSEDAPVES